MSKRVFPNGSVRDDLGNKPMLELVPYDLFLNRVGYLYTKGANHYGCNNWRKGQPMSTTIGSLQRHLAKYMMGMDDEDHLSAVVFNALSLLNADEYFKNDPLVNDINDWFIDSKPTGRGNYEEKTK
jgi:hypothetical protein